MAELEQGLEELKVVKQAFKDNFESDDISTTGVEFRNMPNLMKQMEKKLPTQTKTVTPTTSEQNISADTGYKLTGVKVEAVTKNIDANIKAENIKKGVAILGQVGTFENDVVNVSELPTANIDDNKVYRVNSYVGAYYMMYFGALTPLTNYFQYREIRVPSIDDVTEPEITTGADDMVIYTDTSTYIGYVFMDAESPTSLGVFFGESDDFNKGYIDDTSNITESGIYYTQTVTSKIGVPNKNNEEILEYWLNEKWTQYLRLTRDMIVGVWKYDNGDYVEYLELKADGTASLKGEDGIIQKDGTFSIGSGSYFTNLIIVTFSEDDVLQLNYVVTEDAVKLGINVNDGQEYYVKQSEYVVAEVSGGGDKFGELVNGTIETVTTGDLADVTLIRDGAFENITTLTSVSVPSNVITIGANAFNGCSGLIELNLSEGLVTIGANAFNGLRIGVLKIPSTVISVGEGAFANNKQLTSVTIPSNITVLPDNLFGGCDVLTEVTMEATTPLSVINTTFPSNVVAIKVPYSSYDSYVASWTTYADKIVRLPAIPSTITVTVDNYLGELVSGATVTIEGNGQTYTGTTNDSGVFVQGDLQPATYTVSVADIEGFQTPDVSEVVVVEDSQNAIIVTYLEKPAFGVYGVSWTNDETTTMTRTDDAVNMTYSKNSSTGKITSDFDSVFPYNEMKRQVIDGNTFVYVPKMFFRVVTDDNQKITSIAVSGARGSGDNWYETKPFYYGSYGASSDGTVLKSVSGASRLNNITRDTARQRAMTVGTGYHQRDLYAGTVLMFLWWIEFATKNSQNIMGGASYHQTTGNTDNIYNEENGENFCVTGYDVSTNQMVWHGIEDYFGNVMEWEDGATGNGTNGGSQYVSDNYTLYDDYSNGSKMLKLSFNSPTTTGDCVEAIGWDKTKPFLCLPISTINDEEYVLGFCDTASVSNRPILARGSYYTTTASRGVSYFGRSSLSYKHEIYGCRLMKEI